MNTDNSVVRAGGGGGWKERGKWETSAIVSTIKFKLKTTTKKSALVDLAQWSEHWPWTEGFQFNSWSRAHSWVVGSSP